MKKKSKTIFQILGLLLFVFTFSYVLYIYEIEKILSSLGISNPYFFICFLAIIGGTSTLTSTTVYLTIIALAAAEYNFFLLGVSAGMGLFVGDTIYYYLGHKFGDLDRLRKLKSYTFLSNLISKMGNKTINIFVFLYACLSPIPNDLLMILLGSFRIKFWVFASSLLIGNIFFMIIIAAFGTYFMS